MELQPWNPVAVAGAAGGSEDLGTSATLSGWSAGAGHPPQPAHWSALLGIHAAHKAGALLPPSGSSSGSSTAPAAVAGVLGSSKSRPPAGRGAAMGQIDPCGSAEWYSSGYLSNPAEVDSAFHLGVLDPGSRAKIPVSVALFVAQRRYSPPAAATAASRWACTGGAAAATAAAGRTTASYSLIDGCSSGGSSVAVSGLTTVSMAAGSSFASAAPSSLRGAVAEPAPAGAEVEAAGKGAVGGGPSMYEVHMQVDSPQAWLDGLDPESRLLVPRSTARAYSYAAEVAVYSGDSAATAATAAVLPGLMQLRDAPATAPSSAMLQLLHGLAGLQGGLVEEHGGGAGGARVHVSVLLPEEEDDISVHGKGVRVRA